LPSFTSVKAKKLAKLCTVIILQSSQDHAMVQTVSRQPLKTGTRLRSQASSFKLVMDKVAKEPHLSATITYPCDYLPPIYINQQLHFGTCIFLVKFQCHCIANQLFLRRSTDDQR